MIDSAGSIEQAYSVIYDITTDIDFVIAGLLLTDVAFDTTSDYDSVLATQAMVDGLNDLALVEDNANGTFISINTLFDTTNDIDSVSTIQAMVNGVLDLTVDIDFAASLITKYYEVARYFGSIDTLDKFNASVETLNLRNACIEIVLSRLAKLDD